MTAYEAAVVSAYTGFLIGEFSDLHEYIEDKFGHPVWTHQMGEPEFQEKLRDLARPDFVAMEVV